MGSGAFMGSLCRVALKLHQQNSFLNSYLETRLHDYAKAMGAFIDMCGGYGGPTGTGKGGVLLMEI